MMKVLEQNPYRYLGVYSNSPIRERVANLGKMKAFLKVGKQVSFPLDLSNFLPPINRTTENVVEAEAKLTLFADQIKYAQFWWIKVTHIDDIAFNHLVKGEVEIAQSIWEKKEDVSSLQNRAVLALMQGDYSTAIKYTETLYKSYAKPFVSHIVATGTYIDRTMLAHNFIDVLIEEGIDPKELRACLTDGDWENYINDKTITPLVDSITKAITVAQTSRGKGPDERYKAGQRLMKSTKEALQQLKSFIPITDIRYETIVDKLGIEILQCGIDYFNSSEDDDRAHKGMRLQSYALSIVVGSLAKDRCRENVDIFKKIISELPPVELIKDCRAITAELDKFSLLPKKIDYAVVLLNNTKSHLQTIKSRLGSVDSRYLKISTRVVASALDAIITEVNSVVNASHSQISSLLSLTLDVLPTAWTAMELMDKFDMEIAFKTNVYNPNRAILKDICCQLNISKASDFPKTPPVSQGRNTTSNNSGQFQPHQHRPYGCIIAIVAIIVIIIIIIASHC